MSTSSTGPNLASKLDSMIGWAVDHEGSTRSSALIRIMLVCLLWTRWAEPMILYRDYTPQGIALSCLFFVGTTLLLVGWRTRLGAFMSAVATVWIVYWLGAHEGNSKWIHHHTVLLCHLTVLVALLPSGKSYSVDRWLALRRAEVTGTEPPAERGPLWGLRLICIQVSIVYFAAAYDKLNIGFLSGERLAHLFMDFYWGSTYPDVTGFGSLAAVVGVGTVAAEIVLGVALWSAVGRKMFLVPGLILHAIFYVALPVATYSATMWVMYLAFIDPRRVHDVIDRLSGTQRGGSMNEANDNG